VQAHTDEDCRVLAEEDRKKGVTNSVAHRHVNFEVPGEGQSGHLLYKVVKLAMSSAESQTQADQKETLLAESFGAFWTFYQASVHQRFSRGRFALSDFQRTMSLVLLEKNVSLQVLDILSKCGLTLGSTAAMEALQALAANHEKDLDLDPILPLVLQSDNFEKQSHANTFSGNVSSYHPPAASCTPEEVAEYKTAFQAAHAARPAQCKCTSASNCRGGNCNCATFAGVGVRCGPRCTCPCRAVTVDGALPCVNPIEEFMAQGNGSLSPLPQMMHPWMTRTDHLASQMPPIRWTPRSGPSTTCCLCIKTGNSSKRSQTALC
jgi:hypothetical protein